MTRAQAVERAARALLDRVEDDALHPADEFTRVQRDALRAALSLPPEAAAPVATPTCYRGTVGCHFGQEYGVGCCPGKAPHSITCDRLMDARVGPVPPPREGG